MKSRNQTEVIGKRSFKTHSKLNKQELDEGPSKKLNQGKLNAKKTFTKQNAATSDPAKKEKKLTRNEKGEAVKFNQLNKLYNELMVRKTVKNSRTKKAVVDDVLRMTSGVLAQIANKHDGCRIIQGCLKYGDDEQKKQIIGLFLTNVQMPELAKSKYGHHLAIKMTKYLDKKQIDQAFEYILKQIDIVVTLIEGAKTISGYVEAGASKAILNKYLDPIVGAKDDDATTHERLENAALKIADKKAFLYPIQQRIMTESLRILIPGEREKILEVVSENLSSFVFNQEGVDLVCNSLDLMDVKQKKQLLKGLKGKIKELLLAENSLFHLVLIKILSSVDDTTVVKKTILNEITKDIEELIQKPHVNDVLLSIYDPKEDYLAKHVKQVVKQTGGKKDNEIRRAELIEYTLESLVNIFSFQLGEYIANPKLSKLLAFVIKHILEDNKEDNFNLVTAAIDTVIDNYNKSDKAKDLEHKVLISHPSGHRLVKSIVSEYKDFTGEAKEFYDEIIQKIMEFVTNELPILLQTKAIFVVIALVESTDYKDQIVQEVNRNKHIIKNLKGAGAEILKKHL